MSLLKRALKSVLRRPSKSFVLFAIVFLLGNLLCASLAISTSVSQLKNGFIQQLGAKIVITQKEPTFIEIDESYERNLSQLLSNIDEIKQDNYDKFNDIHYSLNALTSSQLVFENEYTTIDGSRQRLPVFLYGCNETHLFDIIENRMELVEGRLFNEDELVNGKRVVVLSDRFFKKENNELVPLHVGDTIELSKDVIDYDKQDKVFTETLSYEVIGIVRKLDSLENIYAYKMSNLESRLMVPNAALEKEDQRLLELNGLYPNYSQFNRMQLHTIEFKLKEPKYSKSFNDKFNRDNPLLNSFDINTSQDIYDKIAAPLNSLVVISDSLITITTIAVIVLLSLVVVLFLKDRRYEFGVLYSMGEKRLMIITQIVMELLMIGLIAISCAMFTGRKIGNMYSAYMIENQRAASQYVVVENISQDEFLDEYDTVFSQEYIQKVYITATLVILISSVLPTAYILHLKPKKILI